MNPTVRPATATTTPEYYWRSLLFFSYYRLVIAALMVIGAANFAETISFGLQDAKLFLRGGGLYVLAALALIVSTHRRGQSFAAQLTMQSMIDIALMTLLIYASGGQKSGLGLLMLVSLAGAGLVGEGRMVLFFASIASVAMLIEQTWRTLRLDGDSGDFVRTGLLCVSFFVMAITARLLARRVVANEELARARGIALDRQLAIGRRIIADMSDGVLVLDAHGQVQQSNGTAERLLQARPGSSHLRDWSPHLASQMRSAAGLQQDLFEVVRSRDGKLLRLRLLPASERGGDAVVYVEDMERIQQQAQQLKLAALGRLTANIAHEIRNPLAAISHAAELLTEDEPDPVRRRLATIIGDNTQRLNQLVTDVLELGRRDHATQEILRWDDCAHSFFEEFLLHDPSVATRVRISNDAGEQAAFRFDRGHLHRVLWNLLANALRHASPAHAAIDMRLIRSADDALELHLRDDGPGIADNIRRQIFEPFITSHGAGTGLGLYIARELCEANGGRLSLTDAVSLSDDTDETEESGRWPGAHFVIHLEAAA